MKPLLHTKTKRALEAYLQNPTHGLVLSGEEGVGKYFIANWLAQAQGLSSYIVCSEEDKSAITIEQIRNLYNATRTGNGILVIIDNAHQMGREAQNAFLKLLEEPPKNTRFILTTPEPNKLLSTIHSRTQLIEVHAPAKQELAAFISELGGSDATSLAATTKGLPGRITTVLSDPELSQTHFAAVDEAKQFYTSNTYQRHLICLTHSYDKAWVKTLLELLTIILESLIKTNSSNAALIQKFTHQATLIEQTAQNVLAINGNPKIHLARLCHEL